MAKNTKHNTMKMRNIKSSWMLILTVLYSIVGCKSTQKYQVEVDADPKQKLAITAPITMIDYPWLLFSEDVFSEIPCRFWEYYPTKEVSEEGKLYYKISPEGLFNSCTLLQDISYGDTSSINLTIEILDVIAEHYDMVVIPPNYRYLRGEQLFAFFIEHSKDYRYTDHGEEYGNRLNGRSRFKAAMSMIESIDGMLLHDYVQKHTPRFFTQLYLGEGRHPNATLANLIANIQVIEEAMELDLIKLKPYRIRE